MIIKIAYTIASRKSDSPTAVAKVSKRPITKPPKAAFAFIHLTFAYHMLSLILSALGVLNSALMLAVTLGVCAIFFISYVIVFMITSRSYRKIVSM